MKKVLAILILLLYLPAVSGMAINLFYCCGELASVNVQLISNAHEQHAPDGKDNCCKNNIHYFKVHDAQQAAVSGATIKAPVLSLDFMLPPLGAMANLCTPGHTGNNFFFNTPPLQTTVPLFLENRILLI